MFLLVSVVLRVLFLSSVVSIVLIGYYCSQWFLLFSVVSNVLIMVSDMFSVVFVFWMVFPLSEYPQIFNTLPL